MALFYLMLKGGLSPDVFATDDVEKLKTIIQLENELMQALHPKIIEQFNEQTKDMVYQKPSWIGELTTIPSSEESHRLFRKLSKVYHPDKGGDAETFARIRKYFDEGNVALLSKMCEGLSETSDLSEPDLLSLFGTIPQFMDDIRWGWFRPDGIGALVKASFVRK